VGHWCNSVGAKFTRYLFIRYIYRTGLSRQYIHVWVFWWWGGRQYIYIIVWTTSNVPGNSDCPV